MGGGDRRVGKTHQRDPRWERVVMGQHKRRLSSADAALCKLREQGQQCQKNELGRLATQEGNSASFARKRHKAQSTSVSQQSQRRRNSCPAILSSVVVELCVSMHAQIMRYPAHQDQEVSHAQTDDTRSVLRTRSSHRVVGFEAESGDSFCSMPAASQMGGGESAVSPWIENGVWPLAGVSLLPNHYGYAYLTSMRAAHPNAPSIDHNGVFLRRNLDSLHSPP